MLISPRQNQLVVEAAQKAAIDAAYANWAPTPENINALPLPLRKYIHELETICDPSGDVRALFMLKEENAMLRAECMRLANGQVTQGSKE